MTDPPEETGGQRRLQGRVDRLEEAVGDISKATANDNGGAQSLLRGRVRRLEEGISEIYEAQAAMEQSLRVLSLASLRIKRALSEVVSDLAALPGS